MNNTFRSVSAISAALSLLPGCSKVLGLDEFVDAPPSPGADGGVSGAATSGGGAGTGQPPTVPILKLPINDAYVGTMRNSNSRRPRFAWEASTSPTGAFVEYELQYGVDLEWTDATTITTARTEYQPDEGLDIALLPPVGRRYYWRVRACSQGSCSEFSRARWINVGRPKCDFDADGYDDLAISAYDVGGIVANAIYFYYGSDNAQFSMGDTDVTFSPAGRGDGFGASVSCAGDVDGDGYADVLTGAPYGTRAYVYRGGDRQRATRVYYSIQKPLKQGNFGTSVASANDVNGDGFTDIIVGTVGSPTAYLYLGEPTGLSAPVTLDEGHTKPDPNTGTRISSAGDINGDGLSDVMATFYSPDRSVVRVYHGNPDQGLESKPSQELISPSDPSSRTFGFSIAAAGDINGDGFGDIVIGENGSHHAYIYLGGTQGLHASPSITLTGNDRFGFTVAAAGDINHDGYDDIAIADGSPQVLIYHGGGGADFSEPQVAIYRDAREIRTGQRLGSPGDVNGDGYSDLTLARTEDNAVFLYLGGPTLTSPATEDMSLSQPLGDREFGFAVAHR